jgi:hypothetical protein
LNGIKQDVVNIFLFSSTEMMNNSYKGRVPAKVIYHTLEYDKLCEIVERQEQIVNIYKQSQNVESLKKLYKRKRTPQIDEHINNQVRMIYKIQEQYKRIQNSDERQRKLDDLAQISENKMREAYKCGIKMNRDYFVRLKKEGVLGGDELLALSYLDQPQPNIVIILEDFAEVLKGWGSPKYRVFTGLFYRGRHSFITLMISCQDDVDLPRNCRGNAHVTVFTNELPANMFFTRTGSNPVLKKFIQNYSQSLFSGDRKLVYFKDKNTVEDKFKFVIPHSVPREYIGSKSFVKYCLAVERSESETSNIAAENPYYRDAVSCIR